jgi:hypothetical protein
LKPEPYQADILWMEKEASATLAKSGSSQGTETVTSPLRGGRSGLLRKQQAGPGGGSPRPLSDSRTLMTIVTCKCASTPTRFGSLLRRDPNRPPRKGEVTIFALHKVCATASDESNQAELPCPAP